MLQEADAAGIEALKRRLRARTKIEVVRSALDLLEQSAERAARVARSARRAQRASRAGDALLEWSPRKAAPC